MELSGRFSDLEVEVARNSRSLVSLDEGISSINDSLQAFQESFQELLLGQLRGIAEAIAAGSAAQGDMDKEEVTGNGVNLGESVTSDFKRGSTVYVQPAVGGVSVLPPKGIPMGTSPQMPDASGTVGVSRDASTSNGSTTADSVRGGTEIVQPAERGASVLPLSGTVQGIRAPASHDIGARGVLRKSPQITRAAAQEHGSIGHVQHAVGGTDVSTPTGTTTVMGPLAPGIIGTNGTSATPFEAPRELLNDRLVESLKCSVPTRVVILDEKPFELRGNSQKEMKPADGMLFRLQAYVRNELLNEMILKFAPRNIDWNRLHKGFIPHAPD